MFEYIFQIFPENPCSDSKPQEVILRLPMQERESDLVAALTVIYFDHEILPVAGEWRSEESPASREAIHTAKRNAKRLLEAAAS